MVYGTYSKKRKLYLKAQAACSESQDIGTLDLEALFASSERVKCPEILAAGAR
ncbi:hypothetical protein COM24_24320 [Bacillus toyonensis]|uniref:Uncharacterized protein n=1 Tax=Bacillus toyonensis TaxID=155322 RepID=A0AAP8JVV5_9BACI|nr:hypothetical protein BK712_21615 [Bacillus thuringiensis serovar seoulensis]PDZ29741.1 hypothetical protein CON85_05740 [Bacillus toyonensis]PEA30441.1 hypothetical protein COO13_25690 [Bacillus toyonensis]PEA63473.1 hypothetical protein COO18_28415 [Bacillus toyonensis]PEB17539.1 hypothetical protein COO08_17280 [Bacillus toyonensis]